MKRAFKTTALLVALTATNLAFADVTLNSGSASNANSGSSSISTNAGNGSSSINNASTSGSKSNSGSSSTATGNSQNVNLNLSMPSSYSSGSGSEGSSSSSSKVTVENTGTSTVKTTPSIAAPALTTTLTDTCMGSVSFGVSITGFGASGGSTMVDEACVRRLDSREFRAMGLNDVALALLCQSNANRKAVEAAGRVCPGTLPVPVAAAPAPAAPVSQTPVTEQAPLAQSPSIQEPITATEPLPRENAELATTDNISSNERADPVLTLTLTSTLVSVL